MYINIAYQKTKYTLHIIHVALGNVEWGLGTKHQKLLANRRVTLAQSDDEICKYVWKFSLGTKLKF